MGKKTTLSLGTVSEGTLLPKHLVEAWLSVLEPLRLSASERKIVREARRDYRAYCRDGESAKEGLDLVDDLDQLAYIADEHVPPCCYAGSTDGDGACIGVWVDMESVKEAILDGYMIEVSDLAALDNPGTKARAVEAGQVLVTNDHGNATLYSYPRGRLKEVWSIV